MLFDDNGTLVYKSTPKNMDELFRYLSTQYHETEKEIRSNYNNYHIPVPPPISLSGTILENLPDVEPTGYGDVLKYFRIFRKIAAELIETTKRLYEAVNYSKHAQDGIFSKYRKLVSLIDEEND